MTQATLRYYSPMFILLATRNELQVRTELIASPFKTDKTIWKQTITLTNSPG